MDNSVAGLIDPAVDNDINLGDHIISEAVRHILTARCGFERIVSVPSIWRLRPEHYRVLRDCDVVVVGGTNLLSSNMNVYNQWKINLLDALRIKKVVLLGVGWWQYQRRPNLYTRILLRRVLDGRYHHSVRDGFTKKQLASMGICNVLNTCCPTLWGITPDIQKRIPRHKATDVIFTVTCYNMKPKEDGQILNLLFRRYRHVFLWPQGRADRQYAEGLSSKLRYINGAVSQFDRFLDQHDDVDYLGTRLHAGARAMQKGRRTLVLGLDNRAREIGRDVNLNVIDRADAAAVEQWIDSDYTTEIRLPVAEMDKWVRQFNNGD